MIKLSRSPRPDSITDQLVQKWTNSWCEKTNQPFKWPQLNKQPLSNLLRKEMEAWHFHKCAFCENAQTGLEIEHFVSKTQDCHQAFSWDNLFLCCGTCNKAKSNKDSTHAIKPDIDDPELYLEINPLEMRIKPRAGLSEEENARAEKTIGLYNLARPELKRQYQFHWRTIVNPDSEPDFHSRPPQIEWILEFVIDNPELIKTHTKPDRPYSLMMKSFLAYYEGI